ncbi:MAG: DegT/DnrJ/EryC1/StrS family aminotransferase [Candidatus Adiutrix intracellularis]|nr:DegT/DnrJ/EryC1/StrS family aminotransferase [Candidatus Adiutrix intracellularis]
MVTTLKQAGIPTIIYYPAHQYKLTVYKDLHAYDEIFPGTRDYYNQTFCLPMYPHLEEPR